MQTTDRFTFEALASDPSLRGRARYVAGRDTTVRSTPTPTPNTAPPATTPGTTQHEVGHGLLARIARQTVRSGDRGVYGSGPVGIHVRGRVRALRRS